jgi:hypothetical protein
VTGHKIDWPEIADKTVATATVVASLGNLRWTQEEEGSFLVHFVFASMHQVHNDTKMI